MPSFSFVIVVASPSARDILSAQISATFQSCVFTAADFRSGMSLIRREQPRVTLVEPEFAVVDGRPVRELIHSVSPKTIVVVLEALQAGLAISAGASK